MTGYLIHIPLLLLLVYFLRKQFSASPIRAYFLPGIIVRAGCGIGFGLLYLYYYSEGDTWAYFEDAVKLADTAQADFFGYLKAVFMGQLDGSVAEDLNYGGQPRAFLFVRLLSILTLVTFGNYWISGIYLSLIAFLGMWMLAHTTAVYYPRLKHAAAIGFLFFPSVVFFSSGIGKESLTAGIVGFLCALVIKFSNSGTEKRGETVFLFITGLLLAVFLWQLKYYYFAALIPVLAAYLIVETVHKRVRLSTFGKIALFVLILGGSAVAVIQFHPNLWASRILEAIVINHDAMISSSGNSSAVIHFTDLSPDIVSFLKNVPLALLSGLYGPFLWNADSVFLFFAGLEGLFLTLGTLWAVFRAIRSKFGENGFRVFVVVIYVVVSVTLLAFASPNYGTLIRYKSMFTPFLAFLLLAYLFKNQ